MMRVYLSVFLLQAIATIGATPSSNAVLASESKNSKTKSSPIHFIQKLDNQFVPRSITHSIKEKTVEAPARQKSLNNHELLNSLGLTKQRSASNHHRKRLAVESRHRGSPDDSHMFIIKLPPNPHYYSHNTPVNDLNSIDDKSRKIPVGFKSNGKATGIYHWNIPTLKKMFGGGNSRSNSKKYRQKMSKLRHNDVHMDELIDIKNTPTWSKSPSIKWHENETVDKHTHASNSVGKYDVFNMHGLDDDERLKVLKKKSSPSYYAPAKKQNFQKYFPSNGKPKSFYIIENNARKADQNKKPVSYHNLIL